MTARKKEPATIGEIQIVLEQILEKQDELLNMMRSTENQVQANTAFRIRYQDEIQNTSIEALDKRYASKSVESDLKKVVWAVISAVVVGLLNILFGKHY